MKTIFHRQDIQNSRDTRQIFQFIDRAEISRDKARAILCCRFDPQGVNNWIIMTIPAGSEAFPMVEGEAYELTLRRVK